MTDRTAFERWFEDVFMDGMDSVGEWDEQRNCYVIFQVHMAYVGWQAAVLAEREQCAKVCIKGDADDCAAAIRGRT